MTAVDGEVERIEVEALLYHLYVLYLIRNTKHAVRESSVQHRTTIYAKQTQFPQATK